jgi:hypothetical protein
MKKRSIAFICSIFLFLESATAQTAPKTVAFYGAVSDVSDTKSISMAQELFYTQLLLLDSYTVLDRRDITYSDAIAASLSGDDLIIFYAEILQNGSGWDCTLHAKLSAANDEAVDTKHYDSYYHVLVGAKTSVMAVFQLLERSDSESIARDVAQPDYAGIQRSLNAISPAIEGLAGVWHGEPYTDKIVILRGGKGFIIYKNGAAMDISVTLSGGAVVITQTSKQSASFFPDLAREVALVVAQTAPPVEWTFQLDTQNRLVGKKKTVQPATQEGNARLAQQIIELAALWERD